MNESQEIKRVTAMRAGGKRLRVVKQALQEFTQDGTTYEQIEDHAQYLIAQQGGTPNFALVPGYHWATCVMVNDALCHGIPQGGVIADGDIVTIDVGLLFDGYHLDTSISFGVGKISAEKQHFLDIGRQALKKAIARATVGNSVYQVSKAMQKTVEKKGFGAVFQLTGHGIGIELHQDPSIPCVAQKQDKKNIFQENQTVAIEIMYSMGNPLLIEDDDGWTYRTADGSLSGMFEETVLITQDGPQILT